jgi:dihydrofolate reductase
MIYNIIVAVCNENGIGINNTIPWYSKEDMRHFSQLTKGNDNNVVVMGHNTWNSIPKKHRPLANRDNIILSRNENLIIEDNCIVKNSVSDVLHYLGDKSYDVCWVIGGGSIYEQFIKEDVINTIIITRIDEIHNCDVFFSSIQNNFELTSVKALEGTQHVIEFYLKC